MGRISPFTLKTVKGRVHALLNFMHKTRDCDVRLYLNYLRRHHNLDGEIGVENIQKLYKVMLDAPVPETIRRSRQKIQEDGFCHGKRRQERLAMGEATRKAVNM